jgi:hypothetical protein
MTIIHRSARFSLAVVIATLAWSWNATAQENMFQTLNAIGAAELDQMRGGFVSDAGLRISLGIERSVLINGDLVTSTILSIPDLQLFSGTGVGNATLVGPAFSLVQNGPNNIFSIAPEMSGLNTVVQNTLNNQAIAGMTKINATVNNIDLVRSFDLTSSVGQMIGRSSR